MPALILLFQHINQSWAVSQEGTDMNLFILIGDIKIIYDIVNFRIESD